jgi:hypothetical protein
LGATMPSQLPKQLTYLRGVIAKLEEFDPDSLGDDNPEAQELVEAAVRSRVRGLDEDKAKDTIVRDCSDLQQWLEQPELGISPAHYIYGVMLGMTMWADFGEVAEEAP